MCREFPSEVAILSAIRNGLCSNQVDAKFARRAVVCAARRIPGQFRNALVLEVVGERTKGHIIRNACLPGEGGIDE